MEKQDPKPQVIRDQERIIVRDPLLHLVAIKWRLSPLKAGLVAYIIEFVLVHMVAVFSGRYSHSPYYRSLLDDYWWWISQIVLIPMIWGYFVWALRAPYTVVESITLNGALNKSRIDLAAMGKVFQGLRPTIITVIFTIVFTVVNVFMAVGGPPGWWNSSVLIAILVSLITAPSVYAACYTAIRLWLNVGFFKQALTDIILLPLHPDGAGGLKPLGQYALTTIYPVAIGASVAAFSEYWVIVHGEAPIAYTFHIAIGLYVILTPILFFAPIWATHKAMHREKERLLSRISEQFNEIMSSALDSQNVSLERMSQTIDKLYELKRFQALISSFPEWPFNMTILRKAILSYMSPIISFGTSFVIDVLSQWMKIKLGHL